MRKLWPLMLLGAAFLLWNRQCSLPPSLEGLPRHELGSTDTTTGDPVRQWENEATDSQEREQALPPPGGVSSRSMVDGVRQGLPQPE